MNAPVAPQLIVRRAPSPLEPATFNREARTVVAVISTGAAVARSDFMGEFDERLAITTAAVDFSFARGAPVLDNHQRSTTANVLGVIEDAWIESGRVLARLRFSARPEVAGVLRDVEDGVLRTVSVGFTIEKFEETKDRTGKRVKTATRWTPRECSVVTVGADPGAIIRGDQTMTEVVPVVATIVPPTPPTPAPLAGQPTPPAATLQAATGERAAVNLEIRSIAKLSGLDQAWIDGQIDASATADAARTAAFEAMRQRSANAGTIRNATVSIGADYTDPEIRARTIGEALYARVTPGHQLSEPARPYARMTTLDIARDCLRQRSMPFTGLAPATIIERALHTTSDFPLILGDAVGRTLRQGYAAVPSGLKRVARQTTARDFRQKHRIQLSEAPRLEKVNEAGEFKSGTLAEGKETYRLFTYGRVISFTRQAIVNDDLGAFADLARRLGQQASSDEARLLVELLIANGGDGPVMSDGKTLFHADHGNKAAAAGAILVTTLSTARTALRKQVGLTGELIAVTPKFLIVPAEKETGAEQVLADLKPAKAEDVNPFSGTLSLVVEPRLASATRWYVTADPAEIDGLEYAYLEGEEGPQTDTKAGFEIDGVQVKVRLDFGAGFVDHRGWFANAGV